MPIPFLLGAAAVIFGGAGILGGVVAKDTMNEAESVGREGENIVKTADAQRENARISTNNAIETLGSTKLNILATNMNTFVSEFSKLKNVNFKESTGIDELRDFTPESANIGELKKASLNALNIGSGIVTGVTGGGIAALGAYGAVGLLGTATTGTAIGSLAGAAATNATLAWFGGGSLAAGGLGVAGGAAILGGLVAGPALLIGSFLLYCKADEALSKAQTYRAKAKEFATECDNTCSLLYAIKIRAGQITDILGRLDNKFAVGIADMQEIMYCKGSNWQNYTQTEKNCIGATAMLAKTLKVVMDTPLLCEDGSLNSESSKILSLPNM